MRGLKRCSLFVISTYISRVSAENVRKMTKNGNKEMQIYEANNMVTCGAWNSKMNEMPLFDIWEIYTTG